MDKDSEKSVGMSSNSKEKSVSSFAGGNSSADVNANFGAGVSSPYAFMGNFPQFGLFAPGAPAAEVSMSKCVSFPPNPNAPPSVSENQQSLPREFFRRENADQTYNNLASAVLPYTDQMAAALTDKLAREETFQQSAFVLVTWLERGECNKQNSKIFYSMIQSMNTNVCRLLMCKFKCDDELNKAKLVKKKNAQDILLQYDEISKVFNAASLQKVWDHFTKPQRKNIQLWKKQIEEIRNAHAKEVSCDENEMQSTDGSSKDCKVTVGGKLENEAVLQEISKLQKEKETLQRELGDSRNEFQRLLALSKQDKCEHEQQMQELRQTLQRELAKKRAEDGGAAAELPSNKSSKRGSHDQDGRCPSNAATLSLEILTRLNPRELRVICLISSFLYVHPFGATMDYMCSYLQNFDSTLEARDIETLIMKFPTSFKEKSTGVGASLKKTWTFKAFD